jgi:hypothetical protein
MRANACGQGKFQKIPNEIKHLEPIFKPQAKEKIVQKEGLAKCSASAA